MLKVSIPKFRESTYLEANPDVKQAIDDGDIDSALGHYLSHGIDEHRKPRLPSETLQLNGNVERCLVSSSGFIAIFGWLGDEALDDLEWRLFGADFNVEISSSIIFRHARQDVEVNFRDGPYDYGFVIFGRSPSTTLLKQPLLLQAQSPVGVIQIKFVPEVATDKRVLDTLLVHLSSCQSHAGLEVGLHHFLAGGAGESLVELFHRHVQSHLHTPYVERFGARKVQRSFLTVLFGSTEPILLQPMLFKSMGIDFGEWVYVCNSPEDAKDVLRTARAMSELYDVMITVVVMTDNVGFGAGNNVGVSCAASDNIFIVNPDIFPLQFATKLLRRALERTLRDNMWGGLLFYDESNLMHSGMYMEHDVFVRSHTYQARASDVVDPQVKLVRVEHYDKGVPFLAERWRLPVVVPAISGAVMAFSRPLFEKIGGFSTRYIYGHYEDADLSLRWAQANGPVAIDPDLRLIHLEGQGSRSRGPQYRAAQIVNRYLFSLRHNLTFTKNPELMTRRRQLVPVAEARG
jgi:GT2 family glycosyltransferase